MEDEISGCLRKRGYEPQQTLKSAPEYAVVLATKGGRRYVAKIAAKRAWPLIRTEINACKRLRSVPGAATLVETVRCGRLRGFIENFAEGRLLIEFREERMGEAWWDEVVKQLVAFSGALEAEKILHNDFWDANVIVGAGPKITVLDYQYTHQYRRRPKIYSAAVASRKRADQAEKKRLGWSSRWHTGGDLNQMLGLLSEYKSIPARYALYVKKHVIHNPEADFPYATSQNSPYFSPKTLWRLWFDGAKK